MQVTFYGVRGSTPAPGADFIKYGGNTACVHVKLNDGTDIVLDAGTGIKALGDTLAQQQGPIYLLLSHNHWDHIQGFPFFKPIYQEGRHVEVIPGLTHYQEHDAVLQQMSGSLFPVHYKDLKSHLVVKPIPEQHCRFELGGARVTRQAMNHPGSGSAYLIEADGAKLAYITDNELYPPYKKETDFLDWVSFAKDADLLIHDAQYLNNDMPTKCGWGHSIAEEAVKLAMAASTKRLALYSHDHIRTDAELDQVEHECRQLLAAVNAEIQVFAAAEGVSMVLDGQ